MKFFPKKFEESSFTGDIIFSLHGRENILEKPPYQTIQSNGTKICIMDYNLGYDYTFIVVNGVGVKMDDVADEIKLIAKAIKMNAIAFDYQGCASSYYYSKNRSIRFCKRNIMDIVNYVKKKGIDETKIILTGVSFGTSVVLDYITRIKFKGTIVLYAPFKSFKLLMNDYNEKKKHSISSKNYTIEILMLLRRSILLPDISFFDNISKIRNIKNDIIFLHGTADEIVPCSHTIDLFEEYSKEKNYDELFKPVYIDGIGHNDGPFMLKDILPGIFDDFFGRK